MLYSFNSLSVLQQTISNMNHHTLQFGGIVIFWYLHSLFSCYVSYLWEAIAYLSVFLFSHCLLHKGNLSPVFIALYCVWKLSGVVEFFILFSFHEGIYYFWRILVTDSLRTVLKVGQVQTTKTVAHILFLSNQQRTSNYIYYINSIY